VTQDPYDLTLFIDGNAYNNPGGAGGYACVAQYPEAWNRADEVIFSQGFHETTNNRMELHACIHALKHVADQGSAIGVNRVLVVTDSQYVYDGQTMARLWRSNGWKNKSDRPIENPDLWKKFLSVRLRIKVRTEIIWKKGKKTAILKAVDRAAKDAGRLPTKPDRGFRPGKVGRSKIVGGASSLYPAKGQEGVVRIYRSAVIRKTGHKVYFDVFDVLVGEFIEKCNAYASPEIAAELHRGHTYRVSFNADPKYPQITRVIEDLADRNS
jgi:ribonuclease HI